MKSKVMSEAKFENVVKRVSKVNKTLRNKGFDDAEIDGFWAKIFSIQERVDQGELDLEEVEVCTGCGTLNIELPDHVPGCCFKSRFKPVLEPKPCDLTEDGYCLRQEDDYCPSG